MTIQGKEYVLMLYDARELPIGCFENYKEASACLGSSPETIMCALLRRGGRMRGGLTIVKVNVTDEVM